MNWTEDHVGQWLSWAEREFRFNSIDHSYFKMSGALLCSLTQEEFIKRAPPYTGDVLLSHFNLLRARGGKYTTCLLSMSVPRNRVSGMCCGIYFLLSVVVASSRERYELWMTASWIIPIDINTFLLLLLLPPLGME